MFFGSYFEFILIAAFTVLYNLVRWTMPSRVALRKVLLLTGSFIILSTIVDKNTLFVLSLLMAGSFVIAKILQSPEINGSKKRKILVASLSFLIFLFCVRNYSWIQSLLTRNGFENTVSSISLIGRVGLSYILFRLLHFMVDAYRCKLNQLNLLSFFNYIFFFPTYLSGPIDRYNNFSFWEKYHKSTIEIDLVIQGFARLFIGSVKKFLIVPVLLPYVNDISSYDTISSLWQMQVALTVLAYSFYIYFDFSGYSDIAIGSAYMLGIKTPENFDNPYFSKDIAEFWKRWHISFSSILGEYVFKPTVVGLSQRFPNSPRLRISIIGYLSTFLICGLWHGSTLNFVYWGLWHGMGLSIFKAWQKMDIDLKIPSFLRNGLAIVVTFLFVSIGWYFFMTPTQEIHTEIKNELSILNSDYQIGDDIELKMWNEYWQGYGHGIDVSFNVAHSETVEVQYKMVGDNEWKTSIGNLNASKGRYQIHGNVVFGKDARNMEPGLYAVRLNLIESDLSFGDIVQVKNYRNE